MRNPRDFFKPLAIGAPPPLLEIPFRPSRMIHFLDFSNEKMVAKVPEIAPTVDILLGNLEDAVPVDRKVPAREGLVRVGREMELGETQLWTRVNSCVSPSSISRPTRTRPSRAGTLRSTGTASSRLPSRMSTVGAISGTLATIFSLEKSRKWIIRLGRKGISRAGSGAPMASGLRKSRGFRKGSPGRLNPLGGW